MNAKFQNYLAILVLGLLSFQLNAQQVQKYDYNKPWTFGFHGGAAWQQSDVDPRLGWGLGIDLAKRVSGRQGSPFAFDWRGKGTFTRTYGQGSSQFLGIQNNPALNGTYNPGLNYTDSTRGFIFNNHRTSMLDLSIEGVITLNQLRENTGWVVQGFGGLGLGFYNVKIDQLDVSGDMYDYSTIDINRNDGRIRRSVANTRDRIYESDADGFQGNGIKAVFTPTLGLGVGYHLADWVSVGLEHRVSFTTSDYLDGQAWTSGNTLQREDADLQHLTNAYLRFHFGTGSREGTPPVIDITQPSQSPARVNQPSATVLARIRNVNNRNNVRCYVNGFENPTFNYNTSNDNFSLTFILQPGSNEVRINATNNWGQDEEQVIFIYNEPVNAGAPPRVQFTYPQTTPFTVSDRNFTAQVVTSNVTNKNDIYVQVNGQSTRNFNFNRNNGQVGINVNLVDGANTIEVAARTRFGTSQESARVIYQAPRPQETPPTVSFIRPTDNPSRTQNATAAISATIRNVAGRNNIRFTVNGNAVRTYNYNTGTNRLDATINLIEGSNTVTIEAFNNAGQDNKTTTIIYTRNVTPSYPPVVTMTRPTRNPYNTTSASEEIRASITNVSGRNSISFFVNGQQNTNFNYNNGKFTATVNLMQGSNTYKIVAANNAGNDEANGTIIYKQEPNQVLPRIKVLNPNTANYTSNKGNIAIRARIDNIQSKNDVVFTYNGQQTSAFTYNNANKTFTATIELNDGVNNYTIQAYNNDGSDEKNGTIRYSAPEPVNLPVVKITQPQNNAVTNRDATTLSATVQNVGGKDDIIVKINGNPTRNFTFNSSSKTLTANVQLKSGQNTLEVEAGNNAGKDRDQVSITYRQAQSAPTVTITQPNDPHTTNANSVTIRAIIKNIQSKSDVAFEVNRVANRNFSFNANTGEFTATINVNTGTTFVTVGASNNGGTAKDDLRINYTQAAPKPVINITAPASTTYTSNTDKYIVRATISNISNRNDIELKINGQVMSSFNFNNGSFTTDYTWKSGSNAVVIKATNSSGSTTKSVNIIYKKPIQTAKPVINITAPRSTTYTTNTNKYIVRGTISNISNRNDIELKVNGQTVSNFNYNNGSFTTDYLWKEGSNAVVIKATNSGGSTSKSVNIIYKKPVQTPKPTVTITSTRSATINTTRATERVTAKITGVKNKTEVQMTVNGRTSSNFSLNPVDGNFSSNIPLKMGENVVKITATNMSGSASKQVTYTYSKPLPKPVIVIIAPKGNPFTSYTGREELKARITGITGSNNIEVLVNGQRTTNWSYNTGAKILQLDYVWKAGNNQVTLKATNNAGTTTKNTLIVYKPTPKPRVTRQQPSTSPYNTAKKAEVLRMKVENVKKNEIKFVANGRARTDFGYNESSGIFTINVNLKEGNNTFMLTAKNVAGEARQTVVMKYTAPVVAPKINLVAPSGTAATTTRNSYNLKMKITGIKTKNDISIRLNGNNVNNFSFNANSGDVAAALTLNKGQNTVIVVVRNTKGVDTKTIKITYNAPTQNKTNNNNNGSKTNNKNNNKPSGTLGGSSTRTSTKQTTTTKKPTTVTKRPTSTSTTKKSTPKKEVETKEKEVKKRGNN